MSPDGLRIEATLLGGGNAQGLGTLGGSSSTATGVNALGQVVGHSTLANGSRQPFLFAHGAMVNVNALVPGLSNVDAAAVFLNDAGQIAGTCTIGGQRRAFLLTPTP